MFVPDPIVDAQAAASSAAPTLPSIDALSDPLDALNAEQLQDWRATGKMPEPKAPTPPADSSPATAVQEQPASTDATPVAASEPADTDPDYKPKTKARISELLAKAAREEERANRAEQRARDLETRQRQPQPDARPAASSPAPPGLVKPDPEAFQYGTADPGYLDALTDYKVAIANQTARQQWLEHQRVEQARAESTRVVQAFEGRAAEARTKHADFDAVALLAPTEIPQGSAADLWVLEDEAGAEILYHLQQPANAGERRRILSLSPREQLKELVRLGDRLTGAAPAARSTQAPPPPATLSTRATPADPVERALAQGDGDEATAAYIRAQNARELARFKGK